MITIDASEVWAFAGAAADAGPVLENELERATGGLLGEGLGFAQEYAPVDLGNLKDSIHIISLDGLSGEYGSDMEYAWMREEGGTITARNAPYLVFQVGGQWVKVKSVTQTGTKYMERSAESLEPLMDSAYQAAIDRALAVLGG